MPGLSAQLPLSMDGVEGYTLNRDYIKLVRQNLTMLMETAPGERIMYPEFGVGLRNFLFEIDNPFLRTDISQKIHEQVGIYMPFLNIVGIDFRSAAEDDTLDTNYLGIRLKYIIPPLQQSDWWEGSVGGESSDYREQYGYDMRFLT